MLNKWLLEFSSVLFENSFVHTCENGVVFLSFFLFKYLHKMEIHFYFIVCVCVSFVTFRLKIENISNVFDLKTLNEKIKKLVVGSFIFHPFHFHWALTYKHQNACNSKFLLWNLFVCLKIFSFMLKIEIFINKHHLII